MSAVFTTPVLIFQHELSPAILTDHNHDGISAFRMFVPFAYTFTIYLAILLKAFAKGRTITDDRNDIYAALESKLEGLGLDGRECMLRFTCELHRFEIAQHSFIGKIITTIFSPGIDSGDKLKSYHDAELRGRMKEIGSCYPYYNYCPVSLFSFLVFMRSGEDAFYADPEKLYSSMDWANVFGNISNYQIPKKVYNFPNPLKYQNTVRSKVKEKSYSGYRQKVSPDNLYS